MFKKILVANRGEIALRIIRAGRESGIKTAVIYSEVDKKSLPVRMADEAYLSGSPQASKSYLNIPKIIEIAKKAGCQAIHPGYGFLAENAKFVKEIEKNNLVFIGSSSRSIALLGDKLKARRLMQKHSIPVVPGSDEAESINEAKKFARQLGYPVLLKAAGGGGGKGMRIVHSGRELEEAFPRARSEAQGAFGDPRVYIEKYLEKPRHIEMQMLSDKFGNRVYLGERECSIQRRHQKIIEESPSVFVDEKLRQKMGETALEVIRLAGYYNAGTVEFLVDAKKNFYFLEVNTRLQVEHPVTEMVTGIDLVKEQIKIASGQKLSFKQKDIFRRGHSLECRIYAEDYQNNFFPSSGVIKSYQEPAGPGVRVDSGIYEGWEVTTFYDPLLAKLVCWGQTRVEAIQRMRRALSEYRINGIVTNLEFHKKVLHNSNFLAGKISTHFVEEEVLKKKTVFVPEKQDFKIAALSTALAEYLRKPKAFQFPKTDGAGQSLWKIMGRKMGLRGLREIPSPGSR